jgi:hypothetical protein
MGEDKTDIRRSPPRKSELDGGELGTFHLIDRLNILVHCQTWQMLRPRSGGVNSNTKRSIHNTSKGKE